MVEVTFIDFSLLLAYVTIIFVISFIYGRSKSSKDPIYKAYFPGVLAKIGATVGFCMISIYYWGEGDTFAYHSSAVNFSKMFYHDISTFFRVYLGSNSAENYFSFSNVTGYPHSYLYFDSNTFTTIKFIVPFELLGFNSFLLTSVVLSFACFTGFWKLYQVFYSLYPQHGRYFRLAILYFPSTLFFTGGPSKDIITFAAFGWCIYSFFNLAIKKKITLSHISGMAVSLFLLISIKPYIAIILVPSFLLWWNSASLARIQSGFVRVVLYPFLIAIFMGVSVVIWFTVREFLDEYSSLDSMISKAQTAQQDLKRDAYQGHGFDIGEFDPSLAGIISKFPIATASALFRPTLFEAENIVMYLSGLENAIIFGLVLVLLLRKRFGIIGMMRKHPITLFCIVFTVFFAFGVGLSTSNFGALARFRIPMLPLFISTIFILLREKRTNEVQPAY